MRSIFVGFACNNACVFCAQGELRETAEPRPVEPQIEAIQAGEAVAFLGGEPTIHDELPAWITAAEARSPSRIVVQTNGRRLAYRAFADTLRAASPRLSLDVALQGSTAAMHEYHTGVPGSFEQTVRGIRNARAAGIPVGVTTVVTRSSFRHLGEIARVAHAAGARALHFVPVEPFGRALAAHDRLLPARDLVLPHLTRAAAEAQRLGLLVMTGDRAATPGAADFFPGLGEVEPPPPPPSKPAPERKIRLLVVEGPTNPERPDPGGPEGDP